MKLANLTFVDRDTADCAALKYLQRLTRQIGYLNRSYKESIWDTAKPTIAEIKTFYRVGCEYLDFLSSLNVITTEEYQQLGDLLSDAKTGALNRKAATAEHAARLKKIANA